MYSVHFGQKMFYMKAVFQENSTYVVSTKSCWGKSSLYCPICCNGPDTYLPTSLLMIKENCSRQMNQYIIPLTRKSFFIQYLCCWRTVFNGVCGLICDAFNIRLLQVNGCPNQETDHNSMSPHYSRLIINLNL